MEALREAAVELAATRWPELHERLQRVAEAAEPKTHTADAAETAGRRGEEDVISQLEQQLHALPGVSSLSIFRGVRLPDPSQGGHKEIDVVAVSHGGICVIEVKNWSGRVNAAADGGWEQQRRGPGAECIWHANPIELLQRKALLLHDFLAGKPNVELAGMGGIQCKLIMPNVNLVLEEVRQCVRYIVRSSTGSDSPHPTMPLTCPHCHCRASMWDPQERRRAMYSCWQTSVPSFTSSSSRLLLRGPRRCCCRHGSRTPS